MSDTNSSGIRRARVYVCHPFGADPEWNAKKVREICIDLVGSGCLPVAPQLYFPQFINERTEREPALELCLEMVGLCDELRVYGGVITAGMSREIEHAMDIGVRVSAGLKDTLC